MKNLAMMLALLGVAAMGATASGATINQTNGILDSIEVGGTTYAQADLVGVTLTDLDDDEGGWIVFVGTDSGAALPSPIAGVMSDWDVHTGIGNAQLHQYALDAPVKNIAGADLVILDWGDGDDGLQMSLDGTSFAGATADDTFETSSGKTTAYYYKTTDTSSSVSDFENATYTTTTTDSSARLHWYEFDLSDLGVASGATVNSLWVDTQGNGDPTLVAGLVPEPATMSLLAVGGLCALVRRRRS